MAKDYLTKELEKYEKSKKAERVESSTSVGNLDEYDNNGDDCDNRFAVQLFDAAISTINVMSIILILVIAVVAVIILVVWIWYSGSSHSDTSSTVAVNVDDLCSTDDATSNIVEISLGESIWTSVTDHLSYKNLEPDKKYYITTDVYEAGKQPDGSIGSELKKQYKKEFIAESSSIENVDVSYYMPEPTNSLQSVYSVHRLSEE